MATRIKKKKDYAMKKLIEVLQQQITSKDHQYKEQQCHYKEQLQVLKHLIHGQKQDGDQKLMIAATTAVAARNFPAFDSTSELCSDYWSRFCTFANVHFVPNEKAAKVFLMN